MFGEFRRRMTWFCALATGGIFVFMTLLCLFVSENAIREEQYYTFLNRVDTLCSYMDSENVITTSLLAKLHGRDRMYVTIYDGGSRMFQPVSADRLGAEEAVRENAAARGMDIRGPREEKGKESEYVHFPVRSPEGVQYFGAAAVFPKAEGDVSAVLLYPLDRLRAQIAKQRWLFAGIDLMGLAALSVFAWIFVKKLVVPLEHSRRDQVQFVASAAHELRSPLAVMLSNLSALEKAGEGEQLRFRENIKAEGLRMSRLVDDLLVLANTDSHSWTMLSTPTELDTLCLDVYERFCGPAREKSLRLEVALPEEELPLRPCDPGRVEQALSVLLDNAISYTPPGGTVKLSAGRHGGGKVRFSVEDNGPGVPDGEKERIFQRFYRTDRSRRDKEHFGLGLSVAKEIVQLHRGRIWVEDAPGGGAVFHMVL